MRGLRGIGINGMVTSEDGLVSSIREPEWWEVFGRTCVAAYQFKDASSSENSLVNLANPGTYNLVAVGSPTWDAAIGWDDMLSSAYFKYGAGLFPASTWTYAMRVANAAEASQQFGGSCDGVAARATGMSLNNTGAFQDIYNLGVALSGGVVSNGCMVISGKKYFINGFYEETIGGGSGTCNYEFYLGTENWGGTPHGGAAQTQYIAVAFYSETLTDQEVADLSDRMNAI